MTTAYSKSVSELTIPIKKMPITLDPQHYEDIYSMVAILQIHSGLLRFQPNLQIESDLAESYKVLDGGKRIQFTLKSKTFSNGKTIQAIHVVRTFQRMFAEKSGFSADLDYIVGAKKILKSSTNFSDLGVKAKGNKVVEFELEKASGIFFAHLASVDSAILPLDENLKYDWRKDAGAGSYILNSLTDSELLLKYREDLEKTNVPQLIRIKPFKDGDAQEAALKGQVDSLDGYAVKGEIVKKLKEKGWQESVSTLTRQLFLVLNTSRIDLETRTLICNILKNAEFDLLLPSYQKAHGLVPFGLLGSINGTVKSDKKLVSLKKVRDLKIYIVDAEALIPYLTKQIKDILIKYNINLSIEVISIEEYLKAINSKKFDIMLRSKFLDYPDGFSILSYFRSNYSANTFFVEDKQVDRLLDESVSELDLKKRARLYEKIQHLILSHQSVVPLVFGADNLGLWSAKVQIVPAHPLGVQGLPFNALKLKE